jgi:hypothetical protein
MDELSDKERGLILKSIERLDRVVEQGHLVLARAGDHPRRAPLEAALASLEAVRAKAIDFLAAEEPQERAALSDALRLFVEGIADLSRLLVEDAESETESPH